MIIMKLGPDDYALVWHLDVLQGTEYGVRYYMLEYGVPEEDVDQIFAALDAVGSSAPLVRRQSHTSPHAVR